MNTHEISLGLRKSGIVETTGDFNFEYGIRRVCLAIYTGNIRPPVPRLTRPRSPDRGPLSPGDGLPCGRGYLI